MKLRILILTLVIAAFAAIYYLCDPNLTPHMPKCMFHNLTSWKCPFCGTQRALHQLLNGNILAAIRYNYFLLICIPYILMFLFADKFRSPISLKTALVLTILWWIGRNIWGL